MQFKKWLTPLIIITFIFLVLGACGHIEEKPTGLEDTKNNQTDSIARADVDETEEEAEVAEDQENDKDKNAKIAEDKDSENEPEDNSDTPRTKNGSDNTNSKNNKEQKNSKKSDVSKDDQSNTSTENNKKKNTKEQSTKKEKPKENKGSGAKENSTDKKSDNQPKSKDKKPSKNKPSQKEDSKVTITLSIIGLSNDVILVQEDFKVKNDNNAFDVLLDIGKEKGLSVESTGTGARGYVQGIEEYREFGEGDLSGWMYSVNGTFPNIGAGSYTLEDGDVVKWLYTTDLGGDIGAR